MAHELQSLKQVLDGIDELITRKLIDGKKEVRLKALVIEDIQTYLCLTSDLLERTLALTVDQLEDRTGTPRTDKQRNIARNQ